MTKKILSNNPLFKGEMIKKPNRVSAALHAADGTPIWKCPNCGKMSREDECDVVGAEPGCVFCNQCNREMET